MRLPIDTGSVKFLVAGLAEPVLDYETRAPKLDENGGALFAVPQFALGSRVRDNITVKVAGDVKGLGEFTLVKVTNLLATTWEVGSNHGVSFRADRIEVMKAVA